MKNNNAPRIHSGARAWSKPQIRAMRDELKRTWKGFWPNVGDDVRDALVRAKCLDVATLREESAFTSEQLFNLYRDLCEAMGLD